MVTMPYDVDVCMNGLNDLKTGMRIFRMIQEPDVLQRLKMQTQLGYVDEMWHKIVDWLSEW